ncbi:MAG: hypothetical protein KatS3mg008_1807 [Acidimicrobiales bacterium]|nr:MAG: hypothetical protein KatS3mg008_1807 [Acidimicrobiales bacterium]
MDLLLGSSGESESTASAAGLAEERTSPKKAADGVSGDQEGYSSRPDGTLSRPLLYGMLAVLAFVLFRVVVRAFRRRS